jgi:hypothetical protein
MTHWTGKYGGLDFGLIELPPSMHEGCIALHTVVFIIFFVLFCHPRHTEGIQRAKRTGAGAREDVEIYHVSVFIPPVCLFYPINKVNLYLNSRPDPAPEQCMHVL